MRYPGRPRARHQRLAERFERRRLLGRERPQRDALRPRRLRREQHLGAAHREGKHAGCPRLARRRAVPFAPSKTSLSTPAGGVSPACSELF